MWDDIQQQYHCCGVDGIHDWEPVLGEGNVPDSCCKSRVLDQEPGCGEDYERDEVFYLACGTSLSSFVRDHIESMALFMVIVPSMSRLRDRPSITF